MKKKKLLIYGSTGLVGKSFIEMAKDWDFYSEIIIISRKPIMGLGDKFTVKNINFNNLEAELKDIMVDDVFCALGTTIKKAGSKENFKKVDLDLVLSIAKILHSSEAKRFLLISSQGANSSSISFYLKIKGLIEDEILKLNFQSSYFLRPSIIDGDREESRPLEYLGLLLGRFIGQLALFSYLKPTKVKSIVNCSKYCLENEELGAQYLEHHIIKNF